MPEYTGWTARLTDRDRDRQIDDMLLASTTTRSNSHTFFIPFLLMPITLTEA